MQSADSSSGPTERELLEQSGWRRWPPRLPEQPIFYPVTNEAYVGLIEVIAAFP